MQRLDIAALNGPVDWSGPTFRGIGDAAVKLRWIDSAFEWHRNDGPELFFVLDGAVDMHVRSGLDAPMDVVALRAGQGLWIEEGDEHVAHPRGPARILVVEKDEAA